MAAPDIELLLSNIDNAETDEARIEAFRDLNLAAEAHSGLPIEILYPAELQNEHYKGDTAEGQEAARYEICRFFESEPRTDEAARENIAGIALALQAAGLFDLIDSGVGVTFEPGEDAEGPFLDIVIAVPGSDTVDLVA